MTSQKYEDDGNVREIQTFVSSIASGPIEATLCIKSNDENRKEEAMLPLRGNGITYVIDEGFERSLDLGICTIGEIVQDSIKLTI